MYQINFQQPVRIHLIGIGGISMSGLAEILLQEGFSVSGSDTKKSPLTTNLEKRGARIYYGQCADNISDDIDCVVYTAAIHEDNPEFAEVLSRGIPILSRAELLGQLMKNYRTPIAISGTHGKTTTTSMLSHVLLEADLDPTISVGGILKSIGGNIRVGCSDVFLTEACEYTNSFLHLHPLISVILNIEEDHLDFFKDLDDIRSSFRQFAELLPENGILVVNGEIPGHANLFEGLGCRVVTYGPSEEFDYYSANPSYDSNGLVSFDLMKKGVCQGRISLSVTGDHNVSNALAAIAVSETIGIPMDQIQRGLHSFTGTDRRFEYKGTFQGVTVIDDYAHHPTEIAATLKAARHYPHNQLWCVFQPHTYTRTKAFFQEFATVLSHTDHLILADIYAARETDTLGVSSQALAQAASEQGADAYYFPSFSEIQDFLKSHCAEGDLVITMGAGDIVSVGEELVK